MCIAHNRTRLVYLDPEQGIEADFAGGVNVLTREPWVALEELHVRFDDPST